MQKTCLEEIKHAMIVRYQYNLDYMRNNPDMSRDEVVEHYRLIKELTEVENLIKEKKC